MLAENFKRLYTGSARDYGDNSEDVSFSDGSNSNLDIDRPENRYDTG